MIKFKIQRFAGEYTVTDLATVGQVKTLALRIKARLEALESPKAIRFAQVDNNDGKLKFYSSTTVSAETLICAIDFPEELYLKQTGTEIVENFAFSAATYPGATDPNLDGKTVLVLAIKGDDETNPTTKYSFVNMTSILEDVIPKVANATAGNVPTLASDGTLTNSTVVGADIVTKVAGATEGNVVTFSSDGKIANSTIAGGDIVTKVNGATNNNVVFFDANGKIKDNNVKVATDAEFTAMLDEVLPTVSGS